MMMFLCQKALRYQKKCNDILKCCKKRTVQPEFTYRIIHTFSLVNLKLFLLNVEHMSIGKEGAVLSEVSVIQSSSHWPSNQSVYFVTRWEQPPIFIPPFGHCPINAQIQKALRWPFTTFSHTRISEIPVPPQFSGVFLFPSETESFLHF